MLWHTVTHGRENWRGNYRMQWVASTLHTTSEHVVSSITTADAHTSAASSRLNWRPTVRFKWTRPFRAKDEIWLLRVCHHISTGLNKNSIPNKEQAERMKYSMFHSNMARAPIALSGGTFPDRFAVQDSNGKYCNNFWGVIPAVCRETNGEVNISHETRRR